MSFKILSLIEEIKFGTPARKGVAMKLAACANDDGSSIYPAIETIAKHAECHERTVQRCLNDFCEPSILRLEKLGGKGPRSSCEYSYNLPLLEALADGDCEIYTYKNADKKNCLGVRKARGFVENNVRKRPSKKGDMVSPLENDKGDMVSNKGDMVSNKGDMVSNKGDMMPPNSLRTSFNEGGGRTNPHKFDINYLFETFCQTAAKAGFVIPNSNQLKKRETELVATVNEVGESAWLEVVAMAAADPLCCGRVDPGQGFSSPWRLTFAKMCDAEWVANKLDLWRAANPDGSKNSGEHAGHIVINPASPGWAAWLEYYQATEPKTAQFMKKHETRVVPHEFPKPTKFPKNKLSATTGAVQ